MPDFTGLITQLLVQAPAIAILLYQNWQLYNDAKAERKDDRAQISVLIQQNATLSEQVRELQRELSEVHKSI